MFKNNKVFSGFSVSDTAHAKEFYTNTLGMDVKEENGILSLRVANGSKVIAYPKPNHSPASFTILNFPVKNIEQAVSDLSERGVVFEKYDNEYIKTDADGIFRGGGPLIAWFKDPDGNILSVLEE